MIVRLHGRGEVITPGHTDFASLIERFPKNSGTRAVIRIKVARVSDSCGYAVPFLDYRGERDTLEKWAEAKGGAGLEEYRKAKNSQSIDGLPAFDHG